MVWTANSIVPHKYPVVPRDVRDGADWSLTSFFFLGRFSSSKGASRASLTEVCSHQAFSRIHYR
jgi:hypothetical protein